MEDINDVYKYISKSKAGVNIIPKLVKSDKSKALRSIDVIMKDLDRCRRILTDHILYESRG